MKALSLKKYGRKLLFSMIAVVSSAALCGTVQARQVIKVGEVVAWPTYSMIQLAVAKHLTPNNYDIKVQVLQDPLTAVGLLASGQLDVLNDTQDYVPVAVAKGLPIEAVSTIDLSYGTDQIVAAPGVKGPAQLIGKKIAAPQAYIGELLMGLWLNEIGVKPNQVNWVDLNAPNAVGPMLSGRLAAAYMYDPWVGKVLKNMKGATVVARSSEPYILKTGMLADTIYMNKTFVEKHRQAAIAIIKAHYEGVQYWHDHTKDANAYISKYLKWPVADVEAVIGTNGKYKKGGLYVFGFDQAARFCGVAKGALPFGLENGQWPTSERDTNHWWITLGLLKHMHDVAKGIDCSLVGNLVKSGYHQSMTAK